MHIKILSKIALALIQCTSSYEIVYASWKVSTPNWMPTVLYAVYFNFFALECKLMTNMISVCNFILLWFYSGIRMLMLISEIYVGRSNYNFPEYLWKYIKIPTDLGSLIENIQCGNFMIFLPLRFYVKSILDILKPQKLPF